MWRMKGKKTHTKSNYIESTNRQWEKESNQQLVKSGADKNKIKYKMV